MSRLVKLSGTGGLALHVRVPWVRAPIGAVGVGHVSGISVEITRAIALELFVEQECTRLLLVFVTRTRMHTHTRAHTHIPSPAACVIDRDQDVQLEYPWAAEGLRILQEHRDGQRICQIFDKYSGQLIFEFQE